MSFRTYFHRIGPPEFMFLCLIAFFQFVYTVQECYDDGAEFCIYQEDILSVDLLPDSFLMVDQKPDFKNPNQSELEIEPNGTIVEAFNAMGFHRRKMNEFLCHGFLAERILTEVGGARVKRRLDNNSQDDNFLRDFIGHNNISIHEKLLYDEGSSKYKDWLTKTTTLDDIYRHYAPRSRGYNKISEKESADKRYDDEGEEYDGAVTGYALPAPVSTGKVGGYSGPSGPDHFSSSSSHHMDYFDNHGDFYPHIHEEQYFIPNNVESYHHHEHHRPSYHHGKGKGHDLSLKDFFEIALTALAFLAFGLFIIQLIMNVKNAATASAAAAILQADIDGTRFRRETVLPVSSPLSYRGNEELNEISHRVLRSIEAGLAAREDDGNCLRRIICEDNKQSRENNGGQRIWIPVWSLGMSWLSGRMLQGREPWSTTLGSVKAAVLGLGGADCEILFPDCDLQRQVTKSRERRRRRRRRK